MISDDVCVDDVRINNSNAWILPANIRVAVPRRARKSDGATQRMVDLHAWRGLSCHDIALLAVCSSLCDVEVACHYWPASVMNNDKLK